MMWEFKVCRGCLSRTAKLEKCNDHIKKIYTSVSGLKIENADGYPNYFCVECIFLLKKAFHLRRKMLRAFYVMKEIILKKKQLTQHDISTVDRRRTNLLSNICYWKSHKSGFYNTQNMTIDNITLSKDKCVNVLESYNPITTGHVKHIIDIRPIVEIIEDTDKVENIEEVIEEERECDYTEETLDVTKEDVDLNNVFEDLIDDGNESDYTLPDCFVENDTNRKKKQRLKTTKVIKPEYTWCKNLERASEMLSMCDIIPTTDEEQKEIFELRKRRPSYMTAQFKCSICVTIYNNIESLKEHIVRHNNVVSYKHTCKVCLLKFPTEELLEIHHSENHKYRYKCKKCDVDMYKMSQLIRHGARHPISRPVTSKLSYMFNIVEQSTKAMYLKMAHKDSKHVCKRCQMRFYCVAKLKRHERMHEKIGKSCLKCDVCSTYFRGRCSLLIHMKLWHLYMYECKTCPEIFYNKSEAMRHLKISHQDANKVVCEFCGKTVNIFGLDFHYLKAHYTERNFYDCVECGNLFATLKRLYMHQLKEHKMISLNDLTKQNNNTKCNICNVQFKSVEAYRTHALKRRHEDVQNFENTCIYCFKMFDTAEEYRQHMRFHDQVKFPKECSYCGLVFKKRNSFSQHQKKRHPELPREYAKSPKLCELCGDRVFLLAKHMRMHAEEQLIKPVCEYCKPPRTLKNRRNLITHIMGQHTLHSHICALCDQPFSGRQECLDHILKLHAPEKPFKCDICTQKFSHIDYLREHSQKNHKIHLKKERNNTFDMKQNVVVYKHMKLNMSLVNPQIVNTVRLKLYSYDNKKSEFVTDASEYIIRDRPNETVDERTPRKRKKKWDCDGDTKLRKKMRISQNVFPKRVRRERVKGEMIKEEIIHDDDLFDREINLNSDDNFLLNDKTGIMEDNNGITVDESDIITQDSGNLVVNEDLDIFEDNGEQFVLINNVVYKVETT